MELVHTLCMVAQVTHSPGLDQQCMLAIGPVGLTSTSVPLWSKCRHNAFCPKYLRPACVKMLAKCILPQVEVPQGDLPTALSLTSR
jgi:hypothetical protein